MSRVVRFDETGGPEVLHLIDETQRRPGVGEIGIKVQAIGVNRLDSLIRSGHSPRPIQLPARLGVEATGTVDSIGQDISGLDLGDPVIVTALPEMAANGSYAEHLVIQAERVTLRPEPLDPVSAAALWVSYSTAYGALVEKAGMRPGDRLLITAASSGVGLAAIQIANQMGAVPLAVTTSPDKKQRLLDAGAAAVLVSREDDLLQRTQSLTEGRGFDIILDSVMGPGLADLALAAKVGGTLITVGWLDPRPASFPMNPLTIYRYMSFEHTLDRVVVTRMVAFLAAGLRSGVISPTIDRVFSLDQVVEAHRYIEQGSLFGKVVLSI